MTEGEQFTVGVISDTHGLVRPAVLEALKGCRLIIHAGDVGRRCVLDQLRAVAPVVAVRGNVDADTWADVLPFTEVVSLAGHDIYVLHNLVTLDLDPVAAGLSVVVFGHSHHPEIFVKNGVLYINPGSAGPKRFKLPVSMGQLIFRDGQVEPRLITLPDDHQEEERILL